MESADKIDIEVAYALPDEQVIIPLAVNNNATVEDAIRQSGILETYPEISLEVNKVGVFGKLSKLDTRLKTGDRVEIYRSLIADPKEGLFHWRWGRCIVFDTNQLVVFKI